MTYLLLRFLNSPLIILHPPNNQTPNDSFIYIALCVEFFPVSFSSHSLWWAAIKKVLCVAKPLTYIFPLLLPAESLPKIDTSQAPARGAISPRTFSAIVMMILRNEKRPTIWDIRKRLCTIHKRRQRVPLEAHSFAWIACSLLSHIYFTCDDAF